MITRVAALAIVLAGARTDFAQGGVPAERLLRDPPPGIAVERSVEVPEAQVRAIGEKLGGRIQRVTNSVVRVQGRPIQVNVIAAVDGASAEAIHATLARLKPHPFCVRQGPLVIEYVGKDLDNALATKTSYELGFVEKPTSVRYRVIADLAPVEDPDPMACGELFKQLVAAQDGTDTEAVQRVAELSRNVTFGRELTLRNPQLDGGSAVYRLEPVPVDTKDSGATRAYSFGELPNRRGIPFATVTIDITVDRSGGRVGAPAPAEHLTAATRFWPSDDRAIVELARQITAGKATNSAKATAILEWLSPGRNVKYSGQTGSRWGTLKVLEQRFGHCWDFSDCFVTLARAAGVPCRQVAGWLYGSGGHVWAEFHGEQEGWQYVDPTGGGKLTCGIYHIPYFTSEDGLMPILYVAMPKVDAMQTK